MKQGHMINHKLWVMFKLNRKEDKNLQRQKIVSTSKLFHQFYPRNIIRNYRNLTNLTPEEIETLNIMKHVC